MACGWWWQRPLAGGRKLRLRAVGAEKGFQSVGLAEAFSADGFRAVRVQPPRAAAAPTP